MGTYLLVSVLLLEADTHVEALGPPLPGLEHAPLHRPEERIQASSQAWRQRTIGNDHPEAEPIAAAKQKPPPQSALEQHSPPASTTLIGRVLDHQGKPCRGAFVVVEWASSTHRSRVRTDGWYSLAGLPRSLATVSIWARRHEGYQLKLGLSEQTQRQDFALKTRPRYLIRLAGAPDNERSRRLLAVATREKPGERISAVTGSLQNPVGIGRFYPAGSARGPRPAAGLLGELVIEDGPAHWLSLVDGQQVLETLAAPAAGDEATFTAWSGSWCDSLPPWPLPER